jgi:hypothetical protein
MIADGADALAGRTKTVAAQHEERGMQTIIM